MKAILFICLAVIATSHIAAAITRAEIIALLQQDYTIDKVLQLFEGLRAQENQDLVDLDAQYAVEEPRLAGEIARTTGLLNAKIAECDGIEATINAQIAERQRLTENVATARATIEANNGKIKAAEDSRCAANILFIGRLAQNQEATQFLNYLREKIAAPDFRQYVANNPGAFIQMKEVFAGKKTDEILTMLAQHHLLSMLQQDQGGYQGLSDADLAGTFNVRSRTGQEIGSGHVDNARDVMQRQAITGAAEKDVDAYITELLGYVDTLLKSFADSTRDLQNAEQASVQALIDYRNRIEDENFVLNRYAEVTTIRIAELSVIIENNQRALAECRAQIPPLQEGVRIAQENYDTYVKNYNDRRANLVNMIDLLGRVIEIYTTEVVNVAGSAYRERTEDYLGDQGFEQTGGFTDRGSKAAIEGYQG